MCTVSHRRWKAKNDLLARANSASSEQYRRFVFVAVRFSRRLPNLSLLFIQNAIRAALKWRTCAVCAVCCCFLPHDSKMLSMVLGFFYREKTLIVNNTRFSCLGRMLGPGSTTRLAAFLGVSVSEALQLAEKLRTAEFYDESIICINFSCRAVSLQ